MIARGAKGEEVVTLQWQFTMAGFPVKPDGNFGNATDNAVREFQSARGLPVDGVVGRKSSMALDKSEVAAMTPAPKPAPAVATPQAVHIDNRAAAGVSVAAWWQF